MRARGPSAHAPQLGPSTERVLLPHSSAPQFEQGLIYPRQQPALLLQNISASPTSLCRAYSNVLWLELILREEPATSGISPPGLGTRIQFVKTHEGRHRVTPHHTTPPAPRELASLLPGLIISIFPGSQATCIRLPPSFPLSSSSFICSR